MKKYIVILFLIFSIQAHASQIVTGINSKNLVVWNIWENNDGKLKHFLYLFNKSEAEVKIEVKLKRYKSVDTNFEEVKTDKLFYKVDLAPSQFMKLDYPEKSGSLDFMEFFENGPKIGLMSFDLEKPDKSFINKKYKYYSNTGANGGPVIFCMRFVSIHDANTEVGISANFKNDKDYFLIKTIDKNQDNGEAYWSKLDSLQKTDKSIIKLDQSNNIYKFQLQRDFGQAKIVMFEIIAEFIQDDKMVRAQNIRVPIFKIN